MDTAKSTTTYKTTISANTLNTSRTDHNCILIYSDIRIQRTYIRIKRYKEKATSGGVEETPFSQNQHTSWYPPRGRDITTTEPLHEE